MNTAQVSLDTNTLRFSGQLNITSIADLWEKSKVLLAHSQRVVYVDLKNVSDCDSTGIALLIGLLRVARQQKKAVQFAHLSKQMDAIIHVTNLEKIIYESR